MSYYGDDDADLESPMFSRKTWVGIVVPLCVVAGIVLIALIFFYRRRHVRQRRNGVSLNQQGRLALERDIEENYRLENSGGSRRGPADDSDQFQTGPNGESIYIGRYYRRNGIIMVNDRGIIAAPRRPAGANGGRRGPRTANRWAWARTTDLTPTSRNRVEGLNELGEAPPPYEPPKKLSRPSSGDNTEMAEHNEHEEGASVQEGVTVPAPAHIRHSSGSGSLAPERTRSIDGDTIAATMSTARTAATGDTAAEAAPRSRPESSGSLEGTVASLAAGSSLASSSSMPSTVATSPPASPPAYSERTAANRADRR
ncbi:hypothetical protein Sste5346_000531 [Sporothrix stenoceras]|uniref:Uncharacterized protein n=1 Tax=Sporothrix stenoceras TaxID=5173 RepID=A0ABR3ZRC9_9PEZI